jgi:hypothetical protein
VRLGLGMVAVLIAGILVRPLTARLGLVGTWGVALWLGLLLVVSYVALAMLEWVIGGVPSQRKRPRSLR